MSFNYEMDIVIGYVKSPKGTTSAQFSVFGYINTNNEYISGNTEFEPYGKVFCPSFFAIESIPLSVKNYETVIKFYCTPSISYEPGSEKDCYSVDISRPITPLPRLFKVGWTEDDFGLGEKRFKNIMSFPGIWQAYPYNPRIKVLFEEVEFNEGKLSPVTGKEIRGFSVTDPVLMEFKVPTNNKISYFLQDVIESAFFGEPKQYIDFMTPNQLKGWIKEKLTHHSQLDQGLMIKLRTLINSIPPQTELLDQIRLARAKKYLDNLQLTDGELQALVASDSPIGIELRKQLESLKTEFEKEWVEKLKKDFESKREDLKLQILNLEEQIKSILDENQKILDEKKTSQNELLDLIECVKTKTMEVQELEKNKELIISTVKILADVKPISPSGAFSPSPEYVKDYKSMAEIYVVENMRKQFESSSSGFDDIEDFLIITLKRRAKFSDSNAKMILDVFRFRASFIPSVSWAYALANVVGNSNVMNLTVEYDWLHYADFLHHGLQEYWIKANDNPDQTFFLVIQNINMVPSECSLLPLLEVFSGTRPVLEGTGLGIPSNLFCLATVVTTKGEHAMGVPLKPDFYQTWGAFSEPNAPLFLQYSTFTELEYSVTPTQLMDTFFEKISIDQPAIIEKTKESYYVF